MDNHRSHCPVNLAVEIFGDKWSLLIIRDIMFEGKRHFREMLQSEEKIATNILTDRLAMLEQMGIITKRPDPEHKQKQIYSLTEKAIDLVPVFASIGEWSLKHLPVDTEKYVHASQLAKANKRFIAQLKKTLMKEHVI